MFKRRFHQWNSEKSLQPEFSRTGTTPLYLFKHQNFSTEASVSQTQLDMYNGYSHVEGIYKSNRDNITQCLV